LALLSLKNRAKQATRARREKQAESLAQTHAGVSDKKLSETTKPHANDTATKLAETFI
jgi:hypothetical protein